MISQDQFNQFFNKYNGKAVEVEDPTNFAQCFDLAFAWIDSLGIDRSTIRHLYAYQIYSSPNPNTTQFFDIIPNTPTGVPQLGDIVVFGTAVGFAGHVCISNGKGDINTFQSFDQNWNGHHYAELVTHNYNGLDGFGWLRPKNITPPIDVAALQAQITALQTKIDKARVALQ